MRRLASFVLAAVVVAGVAACTGAADVQRDSAPDLGSQTTGSTASPDSGGSATQGVAPAYADCSTGRTARMAAPRLEEAWSLPMKPVSAPAAVGGCLVVYAVHGRDLMIVAIDPRTGHLLWEDDASPGSTPPGVPLDVVPVKDSDGQEYVAYLAPAQRGSVLARLVVANPQNGAVASQDVRPSFFISLPGPCQDGVDVCVEGAIGGGTPLVSCR